MAHAAHFSPGVGKLRVRGHELLIWSVKPEVIFMHSLSWWFERKGRSTGRKWEQTWENIQMDFYSQNESREPSGPSVSVAPPSAVMATADAVWTEALRNNWKLLLLLNVLTQFSHRKLQNFQPIQDVGSRRNLDTGKSVLTTEARWNLTRRHKGRMLLNSCCSLTWCCEKLDEPSRCRKWQGVVARNWGPVGTRSGTWR